MNAQSIPGRARSLCTCRSTNIFQLEKTTARTLASSMPSCLRQTPLSTLRTTLKSDKLELYHSFHLFHTSTTRGNRPSRRAYVLPLCLHKRDQSTHAAQYPRIICLSVRLCTAVLLYTLVVKGALSAHARIPTSLRPLSFHMSVDPPHGIPLQALTNLLAEHCSPSCRRSLYERTEVF